MKRILILLIVFVVLLVLGVFILTRVRGRNVDADDTVTAGQEQVSPREELTETDVEEEIASAAETAVPAGVRTREADRQGLLPSDEPGTAGEAASAVEQTASASASAVKSGASAVEQTASASAVKSGASAVEQTASAVKSGASAGAGAGSASSSDDAVGSAGASSGASNPASGAGSGAVAGQGNPAQETRPSIGFGTNPASGSVFVLPDIADGGSGSYQYFEYQVVAVPKKVLAEAAEFLKLPKDSEPTDELLPAIYHVGGYRVIGYSSGYATSSAPVELRMSRSEYFPDFYILPKNAPDESSFTDGEIPPPKSNYDDEEDDGYDDDENADEEEDEEEDGEDDEYDDNPSVVYNNLASVFPFFGEPTVFGNEFFLDLRPPRIFSMESNMKKLSGFSNTDYGDWGRAQAPIFDDNSFSSALSATKGKPMIVAKSLSGNTWTLHVFFTQPLSMPEKTTPATDNENKLVRLEFKIMRAKWNEICTAGNSDGCPAVPSDEFLKKLSESSQLRDLYSPTFRLIPSQEPVSIQLNSRTQFVPLKWLPAQEYGVPAVPLDTGAVWTGTSMQAAARVLSDGKTVLLDYRFEKASQTGWRNYTYSFYGYSDDMDVDADPMNRYARPRQWNPEPDILSGMVKLPMVDTTAFRQTLFLEVGKPVLAARISNPAYQPDTLTLLFVTAMIEDAE